ncbi:LETM1-like protein-domain-containing protein [Chytridium lagenaria]|nr:LETM1-like protein-domain-containing protein [Chytridium lagenaria]
MTTAKILSLPVDPVTNPTPAAAAAAAQAAGIPASQIKPESPVEKVIRDLKEEAVEQQQQAAAEAASTSSASTTPSTPSTPSVEPPKPSGIAPEPVAQTTAPQTTTTTTTSSTPTVDPVAVATATTTATATSVAAPAASTVEAAAPKKSLIQRIKDEAVHYWHGTKLLGAEVSISWRLIKKLLNGQTLTRRENRQLKRTAADIFRLIPFVVILLIPFLELLLPFLLYLFPNMLPSTFESKYQVEERKKKLLKVRLEMARFLQDTVEDIAVTGTSRAAAAKEFSEFFRKFRASGIQASTEDILKVAKKFENELTLNSLSRPQLVSMARYMNTNAFGTDAFLRHQIDNRLKYLKTDDLVIQKEGVESLSLQELQQVCQSRGIRTIGVSPARLRSELTQWLDLHLNHKVPSSLLILSRAFIISEKIPSSQDEALKGSAEALQATLSSLPDQVVNEAQLQVSETSGVATYQQKLNVLQQQEELIADELEQEAEHAEVKKTEEKKPATATSQTTTAAATSDAKKEEDTVEKGEAEEQISEKQLKQLGDALKTMTSDSALQDVKVMLEDLKEERKEYIEDIDELQTLTQKTLPKATSNVSHRVDVMIAKIEKELLRYDTEIGSRLNLIRPDEMGRLSIGDLEEALKVIRDNPGDERIRKIVRRLDADGDGSVSMKEILEMVKETECEGTGVVMKDGQQGVPGSAANAAAAPPTGGSASS